MVWFVCKMPLQYMCTFASENLTVKGLTTVSLLSVLTTLCGMDNATSPLCEMDNATPSPCGMDNITSSPCRMDNATPSPCRMDNHYMP